MNQFSHSLLGYNLLDGAIGIGSPIRVQSREDIAHDYAAMQGYMMNQLAKRLPYNGWGEPVKESCEEQRENDADQRYLRERRAEVEESQQALADKVTPLFGMERRYRMTNRINSLVLAVKNLTRFETRLESKKWLKEWRIKAETAQKTAERIGKVAAEMEQRAVNSEILKDRAESNLNIARLAASEAGDQLRLLQEQYRKDDDLRERYLGQQMVIRDLQNANEKLNKNIRIQSDNYARVVRQLELKRTERPYPRGVLAEASQRAEYFERRYRAVRADLSAAHAEILGFRDQLKQAREAGRAAVVRTREYEREVFNTVLAELWATLRAGGLMSVEHALDLVRHRFLNRERAD